MEPIAPNSSRPRAGKRQEKLTDQRGGFIGDINNIDSSRNRLQPEFDISKYESTGPLSGICAEIALTLIEILLTCLLLILNIIRLGNLALIGAMERRRKNDRLLDLLSPGPVRPESPSPETSTTNTPVLTPVTASTPNQTTTTRMMSAANVLYRAPMPLPTSPGTPYFEGANITEFLERFEEMCEDYGVETDEEKLRRMPKYCAEGVGRGIKSMPEWIEKKWGDLKKELGVEFRSQDVYQQTHSRRYLQAFVSKDRKSSDDLRQYARQFSAISSVLVEKKVMDEYTRGSWFLQGLPEKIRKKLIKKFQIKEEEPDTLVFEKLRKEVNNIQESELATLGFAKDKDQSSALANLLEQEPLSKTSKSLTENLKYTPPVVPAAGVKREPDVAEMTEAFRAMVLNITAGGASGGFNPAAGGNQPAFAPNHGGQQQQQPMNQGQAPYSSLPRDTNSCYYCWEQGHRRQECRLLSQDAQQGLCHVMGDGRIAFGKPGPAARPAFMYRDRSQRTQVLANTRASYPNGPATANVSSITVLYGDSGSESDPGEEDALSDKATGELSDEEGWELGVSAGDARLKPEDKWRTPKTILKRKAEYEKKLPRPKNLVPGRWETEPRTEDVTMEEVQRTPSDKGDVENREKGKGKKVAFDGTEEKRKRGEKLSTRLKQAATPQILLEKILNQTVPDITLRELISCSDALRKLMFASTSPVTPSGEEKSKVHVNSLGFDKRELLAYVAATPKVKVSLDQSEGVTALLDTGAEVNVMTQDLADMLELPIRPEGQMVLVSHTGDVAPFIGVCENVRVRIGRVEIDQHFFVIPTGEHPLVLGQPFSYASRLTYDYADQKQYAVITDRNSMSKIRVRVSNREGSTSSENA